MYEIELKFRAQDPAAVIGLLHQKNPRVGATVEQCDTYFRHPARDFAETHEALRLRSIGAENWWTYKGPVLDQRIKTRREIETRLGDGPLVASQFAETLTALGFTAVRAVRKRRTPYHFEQSGRSFELAMDEISELGNFVEIETLAGESEREQAQEAVLNFAGELRLSSPEKRSYLEMLLEHDQQNS